MKRRELKQELGLTLVELMATVAILALLAVVSIPALTRDTLESDFKSFTRKFTHDIRKAHAQAISTRDDITLVLRPEEYNIEAVEPATQTPAGLARRQVPHDVRIVGIVRNTILPGDSPGSPDFTTGDTLRLSSSGGLQVGSGTGQSNFSPSSVTVFFQTLTGGYRARVVIYQATCQARLYDGWGNGTTTGPS